jgi:hypothetical protein
MKRRHWLQLVGALAIQGMTSARGREYSVMADRSGQNLLAEALRQARSDCDQLLVTDAGHSLPANQESLVELSRLLRHADEQCQAGRQLSPSFCQACRDAIHRVDETLLTNGGCSIARSGFQNVRRLLEEEVQRATA